MIQIENYININELSSYLAYANTPRYLYSKFILDEGIFDISRMITEEEYISYFENFLEEQNLSLDNFVKLYALIFSAIHKERNVTIAILNHEIIKRIKWGIQLKNIIISNQKMNTYSKFIFNTQTELLKEIKKTSNNTVSNFKFENNENINQSML